MSAKLVAARVACALLILFPVRAFQTPQPTTLSKLEAAETPAQRLEILSAAGEAVDESLIQGISKRIDELEKKGEFAAMRRLSLSEITVAERLGDRKWTGTGYADLGFALYRSEEFFESQEAYRKALRIFEELHDNPKLVRALNGFGVAARDGGLLDEAIAAFERAEPLARQGSDVVYLARVLNNFAATLVRNADLRRAASKLEESLRIAEKEGERQGQSFILNNLGNVYQQQGEFDLALGYYRKSLAIKQQLGNKREMLTTLNNIGLNEHYVGKSREALATLNNALNLANELGLKRFAGTVLINRALVERALHHTDQALADMRAALAIVEPAGDKQSVVLILSRIAETEFVSGRREESLPTMRRSLDLAREIGIRPAIADAAGPAGKAMLRMGQLEEAEPLLREGIEAVESMRADMAGGETDSRGFFKDHQSTYQALSELLVKRGKLAEALDVAERAKARVLVDVLRSGGPVGITGAMTPEEKKQESALQAALRIASSRAARQPGPAARKQREAAQSELAQFRAHLYSVHPELKFQRAEFAPASLQSVGSLLHGRREALIEYVVDDDAALAFVIHRGPDDAPVLTAYSLPCSGQVEIETLAGKLRDGIAGRGYEWNAAARRLYEILLQPAARDLAGVSTLIVVPDGPLWQVPFATLLDNNGKYLVERTAVSYTPSLTALYESSRNLRPHTGRPTLLAIGNPDFGARAAALPDSEREVSQIARLYGAANSKVYTGAQALESRIRSDAGQYSVVHLATHATVNNSNPLYSYLTFTADPKHGDDGLLEAREILDLKLNADLAVLSACDTARGTTARGEGVIGMTWALLVAGASNTVVSQWSVDSASTSQFMTSFHRTLAATPGLHRKAAALRTAALDLLHTAEYRHPFYWAPFVLIGNGL